MTAADWRTEPPDGNVVALVWDGETYLVAAGSPDGWWIGGSRMPATRVLCWMPVPRPPEGLLPSDMRVRSR